MRVTKISRHPRREWRIDLLINMTIDVKLLHPDAKVPFRANRRDAGSDLYSIEPVWLEPGARAVVKTGISLSIPEGYYGRVAPRSGLAASKGIDVLAGVIDSTFRGEIGVVLINHGDEAFVAPSGSRIAQLIIEKIETPEWRTVEDLEASARGADGFGSTGWKS